MPPTVMILGIAIVTIAALAFVVLGAKTLKQPRAFEDRHGGRSTDGENGD